MDNFEKEVLPGHELLLAVEREQLLLEHPAKNQDQFESILARHPLHKTRQGHAEQAVARQPELL